MLTTARRQTYAAKSSQPVIQPPIAPPVLILREALRLLLAIAMIAHGLLACGGSPDLGLSARKVEWLSQSEAAEGVALEPRSVLDDRGRVWSVWIEYAADSFTLELVCAEFQTPLARISIPIADDWIASPDISAWEAGVMCVWEAGSASGEDRRLQVRSAKLVESQIELGGIETPLSSSALNPRLCRTLADRMELVCVSTQSDQLELLHIVRDGQGWQNPTSILKSDRDAWAPTLASLGDGRLHVGWDAYGADGFRVFYALLENGVELERHAVNSGAGYQAHAALALEPNGAAWMAWEEAEQFGQFGGLRSERTLGLARIAEGTVRVATSASLPDAALRCDYPNLLWDDDGLIVSMRGLGPSFAASARKQAASRQESLRQTDDLHVAEARSRVYINASARFFTTWWTRILTFDEQGTPTIVELPQTEGDNEATESLLSTSNGPIAVFSADLRSTLRPRPTPFESPIEGRWRVGSLQLPRSLGTPQLETPPSSQNESEKDSVRKIRTELSARKDEAKVYFGDLHRHTHLSRCAGANDGTSDDAYRYARGPGALDFIAITDHFQHLQPWSFWRNQRDVNRYHAPGRLVVFSGVERASKKRGHRNDIYLDGTGIAFDSKDWNNFPEVGADWKSPNTDNTISIPHMMGRSESPWRWRWMQPELHRLFEVYQGARGSYEGAGQPLVASDLDVPRSGVGEGLADGHMFGLIAASDHGASGNGLAGVEADELTRESIFRALKDRRTFAATDFARVQTSLGSLRSGQVGGANAGSAFIVAARSGRPESASIAQIDVFKNGAAWREHGGPTGAPELILLTSRRWGPYSNNPMRVGVSNAKLESTKHRRDRQLDVVITSLGDNRFSLVKGREPLDLGLLISGTNSQTSVSLEIGGQQLSQALPNLPRGKTTALPAPFDHEQIYVVGPSLNATSVQQAFEDPERKPGDCYYARVIFEDGNMLWSSPIRVATLGSDPTNQ
ncbi:MAG: hypothetical protein ACI8TQ_001969 [Planctomycetota bacterium]|jgi:hypothetical protein